MTSTLRSVGAAHRGPSADAAVLRLAGPGELRHVDPVAADDPPAAQLARLFTRSLFGYVGDPDPLSWRPATPMADLAGAVPSMYNAGVGASHRSVVVMLRPGVLWDTEPPRPVTADDVVRGLKRLGNPVRRPAALPYFTSTIRGMAEYCAGYADAAPDPEPSAQRLAAYQNAHDIEGVLVLDDYTLVIELTRPALDLPDLLALPCAAPVPVEYDAFVPGSPELRRHLRSTGPYRPVPAEPGEPLRWERNPVWQADTDPLRSRHLTGVELAPGPASADELRRLIRNGEIDAAWGVPLAEPGSEEPAPGSTWALDPYLRLNVRIPQAHRKRIAAAIDDAVRAEVAGVAVAAEPGRAARAATSLIPPGNDGHRPAGAETAPAAAGADRGDGPPLTLIQRAGGIAGPVAEVCRQALARAGLPVRNVELSDTEYGPVRSDDGRWDLALESRLPEWFQHGERVFVQPLAEHCPGAEPAVARALDAVAEPARASAAWQDAEDQILAGATVVPLLFRAAAGAPLVSDRIDGAVTLPSLGDRLDLAALHIGAAGRPN